MNLSPEVRDETKIKKRSNCSKGISIFQDNQGSEKENEYPSTTPSGKSAVKPSKSSIKRSALKAKSLNVQYSSATEESCKKTSRSVFKKKSVEVKSIKPQQEGQKESKVQATSKNNEKKSNNRILTKRNDSVVNTTSILMFGNELKEKITENKSTCDDDKMIYENDGETIEQDDDGASLGLDGTQFENGEQNGFVEQDNDKSLRTYTEISSERNENHANNFSTIERDESIWVMAEGASASPQHSHDQVHKDDGELLSLVHSSPPSIKSQPSFDQSEPKRDVSEICNVDLSSNQSPSGSVQTFSIRGRSYTIDTSNAFKAIFSPAALKASIFNENSCSTKGGMTVIPDHTIQGGDTTICTPGSMKILDCSSPFSSCDSEASKVSSCTNASGLKARCDSIDKEVISSKEVKIIPKLKTETVGTIKSEEEDTLYEATRSGISISCTHDTISPVSKILATGNVASNFHQSPGMSKSAASSLIERNKTLVKEVRFADQTCVELSERNSSLKREIKRIEHDIDDLRQENKELHEGVVRSVQFGAKMEEERDSINVRMEEQTYALKKDIQNLKTQCDVTEKKLADGNSLNLTTEKELVAVRAKYDALKEEHVDAKEQVSSLIARLNASQTESNLAAVSTAESYKKFCSDMEIRFKSLQEEKEALVRDRDEWKYKYNEKTKNKAGTFECGHVTPKKEIAEYQMRTPTSTILAKTLQSELVKGHDYSERILEAEKIISFTQSKLQDTVTELQSSQDEVFKLKKGLNQKEKSKNRSVLAAEGIHSPGNGLLPKKLTRAITECDEKKRELEHTITHILTQNERLNSSFLMSSLLLTLQQIIRASSRVKKTDLAAIALYANQSIPHKILTPLHCIRNDETDIPVTPLSLRSMEEGYLSVPSGDEEVKRDFKTPFKVLYINGNEENISPVDYKVEQRFDISNIPQSFSHKSDEHSLMEQQLEATNDEKLVLAELQDLMRKLITDLNDEDNKGEDIGNYQESNLKIKEEEFEVLAAELNLQLELLQNQIQDLEEENEKLSHRVKKVTEENELYARETLLSTTPHQQCKKYDELRVQADCFEMELEVKESALKEAENKILSMSSQELQLKDYISSLEEEVDRLQNKNKSILSSQKNNDDERIAERNLREEIENSLRDLLIQKEAKEQTILDLQSELKSLSYESKRINDVRKHEIKATEDLRIQV